MAVIKSGSSTDQMTVDPTSKAARVSLYDTSGNVVTPASDGTLTGGNTKVQLVDGSGHTANIDPAGTIRVNIVTPATLPISALSLPLPAGASQDGTDGAAAPSIPGTGIRGWLRSIYDRLSNPLAVTGTFFQATQPVSAAALPLPANAAQETGGNLAAIAAAMTNGTAKTQTVSGSGVVADVQPKGTQGANALATQDLKDSGRVIKIFTASFTAAATEGLVSLTPVSDGVPGSAGTSFTVTAGKRFRLQALMLTCFNVTAAIHACQVNLRMSASGAVTASSPLIGTVGTTTAAATIGLANSQAQSFPDGIELSGTMQFGISQIGIALAGQTVVLVGYEY
jgi:hypothetical protein